MENLISKLRVPYRNCCAVTKLMALFFSLSISASTLSTNYYVNDNSTVGDVFCTAVGNNANDGLTPSIPMATLTQVWTVYSASLGSTDTVFIDAGTYYQTERDLNITAAFVIQGAGTELTVFDNANGGTTGYSFMRINATVKLNNFKIYRYGRSGTYAHAIHLHAGVLGVELNNIQIDNCGFAGASAKYSVEIESGASVTLNGGGLTCNNIFLGSGGIRIVGATSVLAINNYTFFNNSRNEKGICLRQMDGTVTIDNSIYEENKEGSVNVHGVVYQVAGSLTISDCIFNRSSFEPNATYRGGTIALEGGAFHMRRSRITNTLKTGGSGRVEGGAIGINGAVTATIDSCYFSGNQGPTTQGTDIHVRGASATLTATDCTFGSASNQVGTSSSGTITMSFSGNPDVNTNTGITKTNTTAPRYIADPSIDLYSGDCGTSVVLPVELTSFFAFCLQNSINIAWQTASEKNNDYFLLERSINGFEFERIAMVQGAGNTQVEQEYLFSDYDFLPGTSYYRLKQVDFDGKSETVDIISLQNDCFEEEGLRAYYDQQTGRIRLFHEVEARDIVSLSIYAISGQGAPVFFEHRVENSGYFEIKSFKEFVKGIYIVTLQTANEVKTAKISIQ